MNNKKLNITKSIELITIIFSLIVIIFSIFKVKLYEMDENQILYLFSTCAQVIAGLFGITLAGYVFLNDRLEKEVDKDDSLYDTIESLKNDYYSMIIKMGILCVISITLSLSNIALYSFLTKYKMLNMFILNESILMVIIEIIYIVIFVIKVADPNKISKRSNEGKLAIEENDEIPGDLAEFLKYYNLLEDLVVSTANDLIELKIQPTIAMNYKKGFKPQIHQSLYILYSREIIDKEMISEIDDIRKYRNFSVHSSNPSVTKNKCEYIKALYAKVNSQIVQYLERASEQSYEKED